MLALLLATPLVLPPAAAPTLGCTAWGAVPSLVVTSRVAPASAGPPGLCFPFSLPRGAASLPFGNGAFEIDPDYDLGQMVGDTLAILRGSDDPLVHVETLRRAIIYADGNLGAPERSSAPSRAFLADALRASLMFELHAFSEDVAAGRRPADERRSALLYLDLGYFQGATQQSGSRRFDDTGDLLRSAVELAPGDGALRLAGAMGGFDALERHEFERWMLAALDGPERADGLIADNALQVGKRFYGAETVAALRERLRREIG
ncbi:hypothetical protein [Engelhardtia mirabilis]|uniref:Uncharacterized protein n=1 Tax=Engelhardtia mirabilis TaxID=2528011 RepID=A0A518BIF8_9BACT|nr:hypothetical protein Pla133_18310 [Planctomycetes bacterium Pla133]QDV01081.1 hypothetical protein Pla86_18300 [Planctomycetes bacterium Pla86]